MLRSVTEHCQLSIWSWLASRGVLRDNTMAAYYPPPIVRLVVVPEHSINCPVAPVGDDCPLWIMCLGGASSLHIRRDDCMEILQIVYWRYKSPTGPRPCVRGDLLHPCSTSCFGKCLVISEVPAVIKSVELCRILSNCLGYCPAPYLLGSTVAGKSSFFSSML